MEKFKKGDDLVYQGWGFMRAKVIRAHRDGSYTVEPQWWVVRDGDGWAREAGGQYQGGNTVHVRPSDILGPYVLGPTELAERARARVAASVRDAAADLLAVLRDARAMLEVYTSPHLRVEATTRGQALSVIRDAEVAIAKAEGRS